MVDPEKLEAMRLQVEREFKLTSEEEDKYPHIAFLNNFPLVFGEGRGKRSRALFKERGWWERPFREFWRNEAVSELLSNQTPKQFYGIIDEAAELEHLDVAKIIGLLHQAGQAASPDDDFKGSMDIQETISQMVMPVYVRLRAMGYNHYPDLTV